MKKTAEELAREYCKSIGASVTGQVYSAYMAGSRGNSSIVVFKDATYIHCLPNESWEYENDENWIITIPSPAQTHPTPTEAEINEAAESICPSFINNRATYKTGFRDAIQWHQNYQTQGREKPVEVFETNIALAYQELAYLVHYRDNDYLCVGLKNVERSNTYAVGELVKMHKYDLPHLYKSDFDLQSSTLWNSAFVGWILNNWQASQPNPAIAVIEAIKSEHHRLMNIGARSRVEEGKQFAVIDFCNKLLKIGNK